MPLRTSLRRMRFRAKEADWPAQAAGTGIRLRSMLRMVVVAKAPRESGPMRMVSPAWMVPATRIRESCGNGVEFFGGVGPTAFYDAGDDCSDKWDRECVVDVELKGGVDVIVAVVGEDVEEFADEVEVLASDV